MFFFLFFYIRFVAIIVGFMVSRHTYKSVYIRTMSLTRARSLCPLSCFKHFQKFSALIPIANTDCCVWFVRYYYIVYHVARPSIIEQRPSLCVCVVYRCGYGIIFAQPAHKCAIQYSLYTILRISCPGLATSHSQCVTYTSAYA